MDYIFELPVYDGAQKVFRVLNLATGTVYSNEHNTLNEAIKGIEDGKIRAGCEVKFVTLEEINLLLAMKYKGLLDKI